MHLKSTKRFEKIKIYNNFNLVGLYKNKYKTIAIQSCCEPVNIDQTVKRGGIDGCTGTYI